MCVITSSLVLLLVASAIGDHYHPTDTLRNTASLNSEENTAQFWTNEAKTGIEQRLRRMQNKNIARNVIMFLGDGMSVPTLAAARALVGQRNNKTGEEAHLFFETFPTVGLAKV